QQLLLLACEHQARLELEQRGDQHDELGRCLEVELAAALEVIEVGEHDFGELQLEQVDLFAKDQREQQVERTAEHVEVELERGERHPITVPSGPDVAAPPPARGRPRPIRSRTSASVWEAIACARP